jgi:hypothetical protein
LIEENIVSTVRQESLTLETLELLQRTTDYLKRLPVVPVTRALIREIDAHLADPKVAAARREAEAAELLSSTRMAQSFDPVGQIAYNVMVVGGKVTLKVPPMKLPPGYKDTRMEQLAVGVTMTLAP